MARRAEEKRDGGAIGLVGLMLSEMSLSGSTSRLSCFQSYSSNHALAMRTLLEPGGDVGWRDDMMEVPMAKPYLTVHA
jgi:hypothetical protein